MEHRGTVRLETERLILRRIAPEDAQAMFDGWCSDPEVARYCTWSAHGTVDVTQSLVDMWVKEYESPSTYNWLLELKQSGAVIGNISVVRVDESIDEAELGWCLCVRWWGKGYMPEAARAVADFLFKQVGANRVCAKHDVENPKSGRVMQKLGMTLEGIRRQGMRYRRGTVDVACYSVLASEWE